MNSFSHEFDERGYVILRGVLEPRVVDGARAAMEQLVEQQAAKLLATGMIRDPLPHEPFTTRFYRLYEHGLDDAPRSFRQELHLAELFDVFFHPRVLDQAEAFLGGEVRLYPNYTARPKLPDWEGTQVLWHQDGGYTENVTTGTAGQTVDQLRMVNVWTPLVPARVENGCMQFIPGTHKLGVVPHVKKKFYLEIAAEQLAPRLAQAVDIELDPGDVVLFHNLLFHQGQPNRTRTIRWSLDWRYQDATQPTLRKESGHIARSRRDPARAVANAAQWARLSFQ
ncbi:MAG: phytanoyl-CoA dioxygenase family protein [Verrucomicrobiae bacterium]|nr:phytanoyl-CoA dioxygenase family protein [Verrucomicrobiae bacterium]